MLSWNYSISNPHLHLRNLGSATAWAVVFIMLLFVSEATALANGDETRGGWPQAAANGDHLWAVSLERLDGKVVLAVLHRHKSDPPGVFRRALTLPHKTAATTRSHPAIPNRVAASQNHLAILTDENRIWTVTVSRNNLANGPRWIYTRTPLPTMPSYDSDGKLVGNSELQTIQLATTKANDWLLVSGRVDAEALKPPATTPRITHEDETFWIVVMDMPPVAADAVRNRDNETEQQSPEDEPSESNEEETPPQAPTLDAPEAAPAEFGQEAESEQGPSKPGVFLFKLQGSTWQRVAMPDKIALDRRHVLLSSADNELVLLQLSDVPINSGETQPDGALPGLGRVEVFRFAQDTWSYQSTGIDLPTAQLTQATLIDNQAVLSQPVGETGRQLYLLRQTQGATKHLNVQSLGAINVEQPEQAISDTALVTYDGDITLALLRSLLNLEQPEDEPILFGQSMSLSGETKTLEPLLARDTQAPQISPNQWIEVIALIIAITLMMIFWMREVKRTPAALPQGLKPAPLLARTAAGVIDLLPAVVVMALAFSIEPEHYTESWALSGGENNADQLMRGILVIALFILHTWTSELITQTTMGKRIFGLKVVSLDGSKPTMVALTIRNMLRALDLIVPVLLLLPLLWPRRQRLGDMVAQTLVVEKVRDTNEQESDSDGT